MVHRKSKLTPGYTMSPKVVFRQFRFPLPTRVLTAMVTLVVFLHLAACAPAAAVTTQTPAGTATGIAAPKFAPTPSAPGGLTPILPASDMAVGRDQRFTLALLDSENRLISDAGVEIAFYKVTGPNQVQARYRAPAALFKYTGESEGGIYVARANFDESGEWGIVASVRRRGQSEIQVEAGFKVKERSDTPAIGDPVPASQTPTGVKPQDIEVFSSARPVNPALYRVSIADALRQGKPLVALFATPGFCTSRTCGPNYEIFGMLQQEFGDRANFVHVETFKGGKPPDVAPIVGEWGLPSEPWVFIVGADGRLRDKFEGSITVEEVRPRLAAILSGY
ncbi:MAG: hypothetical protein EXR50_03545 [Dehalococcoidia bacterium]|nr:hypothetical protein [Dehalococcoidia bacterium]